MIFLLFNYRITILFILLVMLAFILFIVIKERLRGRFEDNIKNMSYKELKSLYMSQKYRRYNGLVLKELSEKLIDNYKDYSASKIMKTYEKEELINLDEAYYKALVSSEDQSLTKREIEKYLRLFNNEDIRFFLVEKLVEINKDSLILLDNVDIIELYEKSNDELERLVYKEELEIRATNRYYNNNELYNLINSSDIDWLKDIFKNVLYQQLISGYLKYIVEEKKMMKDSEIIKVYNKAIFYKLSNLPKSSLLEIRRNPKDKYIKRTIGVILKQRRVGASRYKPKIRSK